MACDITKGRLIACADGMGGLDKMYLFNFVDDAFTIAAGLATAINPLVTVAYEYEITGDVNNLVQDFVKSRDNGTSVNTQTITAILQKMDSTTSNELKFLVYGRTVVVLKDRNGEYVACGLDDGVDFSINATTGSAKADLNGYTLTGTATTKMLAPSLDPATITALLALLP